MRDGGKYTCDEGLKEIGKGMITLANLFLVIFFLNNYLQKEALGIGGIVLSIYAVVVLYYTGYTAINKGGESC